MDAKAKREIVLDLASKQCWLYGMQVVTKGELQDIVKLPVSKESAATNS